MVGLVYSLFSDARIRVDDARIEARDAKEAGE